MMNSEHLSLADWGPGPPCLETQVVSGPVRALRHRLHPSPNRQVADGFGIPGAPIHLPAAQVQSNVHILRLSLVSSFRVRQLRQYSSDGNDDCIAWRKS